MTILEKIKFEEDWLSQVNLTKENIKIAFAGIRATALEQQPCEDCISRKSVDKIINKWLSHPDYELKDNIYDMTKMIHKLPSVTPKADVLDKIREEIKQAAFNDVHGSKYIFIKRVDQIIDKYKAESEE